MSGRKVWATLFPCSSGVFPFLSFAGRAVHCIELKLIILNPIANILNYRGLTMLYNYGVVQRKAVLITPQIEIQGPSEWVSMYRECQDWPLQHLLEQSTQSMHQSLHSIADRSFLLPYPFKR